MTKLDHDRTSDQPAAPEEIGWTSVADFEPGTFVHYRDGIDVSDEQKLELERIVTNIVRMSFEMNLPPELCGQIIESALDPDETESGDVE